MDEGAACPISGELVDHNASRVTCLYTIAALAVVSVLAAVLEGSETIAFLLAAALMVDYGIRAWTGATSPMQRFGFRTARVLGIENKPSDKAPKRFACRVGFFFVVATVALLPFHPVAATMPALSLLGFNVLDGVFDFCVGCWMYATFVNPWLTGRAGA